MTTNPSQTNTHKKAGVKISPVFLGYFMLMLFGALLLWALQHQYWHGEFGHHALDKLNDELVKQRRLNDIQRATNNALRADVHDLKSGLGAIEEHARLDLGLIKSGETFVELSVAPTIGKRELAVGVDSSQAVESADGLLDGSGENANTGIKSDTGE